MKIALILAISFTIPIVLGTLLINHLQRPHNWHGTLSPAMMTQLNMIGHMTEKQYQAKLAEARQDRFKKLLEGAAPDQYKEFRKLLGEPKWLPDKAPSERNAK